MRANDSLQTGPAVSWLVVRGALVAVVAAGAVALCPLIGWQVAAVVLAIVAAALPQTFAAWGSVGCLVIGMLISEPDLGRAMIAVLVVQLIHVLMSLSLVIPAGSRVVIAALRPSALRLLVVQAIAQPVTVAVMVVGGAAAQGSAQTVPWAAVAGAGAVVALAVTLVVRANRRAP
ncbi:hypothetical protein LJR044_002190 [Microbacterium foliorum]|mgnify:FL=1|jgi:hypothetical protein|uniref:hypothetical protein n=1 Tax=Microbacterium sp. MEJ108Y TaxID=1587523 RepID=UPI0005AD1949|nr:hypothetical protein [Microbacterium sp. MEJ108Y]KIP88915.1 hypothetical protein RU09_14570 [Microbacterium sp. MEJ108Y]